jgi:hypothetical protein
VAAGRGPWTTTVVRNAFFAVAMRYPGRGTEGRGSAPTFAHFATPWELRAANIEAVLVVSHSKIVG